MTRIITPSLLLVLLSLPAAAEFSVERTDGRLDILEDGKRLTSYHDSRVPYLYPIPSDSGANLARHWPIEKGVDGEETDHPHHQSVWFSHGAVNGYDFWAWQGKGEPRIEQQGVGEISSDEHSASFTAKLDWIADDRIQLHEQRTVRVERVDAKTWTIEIDSSLTAPDDREVLLGDTKEGSCALRVDRTLRLKGDTAKGHIVDSENRRDDECWGKRSKWVAFYGPDEKSEPAVIAMMDHPDNLRHPTWWHARDYGLLAANPFGIHDFEGKKDKTLGNHVIGKGETLRLRYLLVVHHGTPESARLDHQWTRFSE